MARAVVIFLMWMCLASPLRAQSSGTETYELRAGDRIAISVLEDAGLNTTALIRPDGKISLPLAGTIDAAGRTPEELQSIVRRALSRDFVEPPTVTVALVGVSNELLDISTIYIIGEVANPGRFELVLPIDVLQALAVAGGPSPFAATNRIQVRRNAGGDEAVVLFDYEMIQAGAVPSERIALNDGDVIVVPERGLFE